MWEDEYVDTLDAGGSKYAIDGDAACLECRWYWDACLLPADFSKVKIILGKTAG